MADDSLFLIDIDRVLREKAGSKLDKAKKLNIPVLSEEEFLKRLG